MPPQAQSAKPVNALPPGLIPLDSPDTGGAPAPASSSGLPPGLTPLPSTQESSKGSQDLSRRPTWWDKVTNPLNPDVEAWAEKHPNLGPSARMLSAAGAGLLSTPQSLYQMATSPVETAKGIGESLSAWGDPNTWKAAPSVLPEALGLGIGGYLGGKGVGAIAKTVPPAARAVKTGVAAATRTPTNELKPWVNTGARIGGGAAGAGIGAGIGSELPIPEGKWIGMSTGGYLGRTFGPKVANALLPERTLPTPEPPGWDVLPQGNPTPFTPPSTPPTPAPSGVSVIPEPRATLPGEIPNYMASVPRPELEGLAASGKPGAGAQLQQLGKPIIYSPKGEGISGVREKVPLPNYNTIPHPPSPQGGASVPTPATPPPTDLSVTPRTQPQATVLPESIQPDFVDKSVHPWTSEARVQNKLSDIQSGETPTLVARSNPDGTVSPVKGHQTQVAAGRAGTPVNIVDAGSMTDGEKAATTAQSHFFPQNDRPVPASLAKDAASERASLPDEIKNAPALPPREGPKPLVRQRGNRYTLPDNI